MAFHSFHLAEVPTGVGVRALARPLMAPGLRHAECLSLMRLGAPVLSPSRDEPVVAVTLARMRLREVPRILRWGVPVERQVRDHAAATLAGAAMRPAHTIATYSVWSSVREMTGMVHGGPGDARDHVEAMGERDRRDFHREFATYRFRPLSEHGSWDGRSAIIPRRLGRGVQRCPARGRADRARGRA